MRKIVTPVILLFVAVVHAPIPAQARLFELLPYNFTTSEPVVLFLTGIALLSLGRFGSHRTRSRDEQVAVSETPARPGAAPIRREEPAPIKRAA